MNSVDEYKQISTDSTHSIRLMTTINSTTATINNNKNRKISKEDEGKILYSCISLFNTNSYGLCY